MTGFSFARSSRKFGVFVKEKSSFTFKRLSIAIFFGSFIIFFFLSFNMALASFRGIEFYVGFFIYIAVSLIVSLGISRTITWFLKRQSPFIEEISLLGDLTELVGVADELIKNASVSVKDLKCAAIYIKEKIDSMNDLLNLSTLFSSAGAILIAFSLFMDWSEPKVLKNGLTQEEIAKILAGILFLCFLHISLLGYERLQKLRRWLTIIDIAAFIIHDNPKKETQSYEMISQNEVKY